MSHICQYVCSIFICYLPKSLVIKMPGVTAHSCKKLSPVIDHKVNPNYVFDSKKNNIQQLKH